MEEVIGSNPICSTNSHLGISVIGVLAHLVERDIRIVEASGSSPLHSTKRGISSVGGAFSNKMRTL